MMLRFAMGVRFMVVRLGGGCGKFAVGIISTPRPTLLEYVPLSMLLVFEGNDRALRFPLLIRECVLIAFLAKLPALECVRINSR